MQTQTMYLERIKLYCVHKIQSLNVCENCHWALFLFMMVSSRFHQTPLLLPLPDYHVNQVWFYQVFLI